MGWTSQLAGTLLVFAALADVFLTVLHTRGDAGLLSPRLNRLIWALFKTVARWRSGRGDVLAYAGPTVLASTVSLWVALLVVGFALIYWPALGTGIVAIDGRLLHGFLAALYFSGACLTTVGFGDIVAATAPYRLLAITEAAIGFSVVTLSLTYLLSIYSTLTRGNAFALELDLASGRHGDAADQLIRLTDDGDLRASHHVMATIGRELLVMLEAHHSYPATIYFHRRQVAYSAARVALLTLDSASLIRSALDPAVYARFVKSSAVEILWGGAILLVRQTGHDVLPKETLDDQAKHPHAEAWRRRFADAHAKLADAGVAVDPDIEAATARYVRQRVHWDHYARSFADYLAEDWATIDPLTADEPDQIEAAHPLGG